jgi:hypothetical protein
MRLIKISNDSYIFNHRFFAEIYKRLARWTEIYEVFKCVEKYYKNYDEKNPEEELKKLKDAIDKLGISKEMEIIKPYLEKNKIDGYLEELLGKDFRKYISIRSYSIKALSHYYKSLEMHTGGRAYFNLLEQMYFVKGDYDDVAGHFNVAVERFIINNTDGYDENLKKLKKDGKKSKLYEIDNYFEKPKT